jgi:hypothetical protein
MRMFVLLAWTLTSCAVAAKHVTLTSAAAIDAAPVADASVQELLTCSIVSLSFHDALYGQLTDACDNVFQSSDRGDTWTMVHRGPDGVPLMDNGLPALNDGRNPSLPERGRVEVDQSRTIEWRGRWMSFNEGGVHRRGGALLRVGPPLREDIAASRSFGLYETNGLSTKHAYHSVDGGQHYYAVGDLPAAPTRVGFIGPHEIVMETAKGLFVSSNAGRTWSLSAQPAWDRFELETARGDKAANPLACTLDSTRGSLLITTETNGRMGPRGRALELTWQDGSATIAGSSASREREREVSQRLVDATVPGEKNSDVVSVSGSIRTTISWSCGAEVRAVIFNDATGDAAHAWHIAALADDVLRNAPKISH